MEDWVHFQMKFVMERQGPESLHSEETQDASALKVRLEMVERRLGVVDVDGMTVYIRQSSGYAANITAYLL
jgi:hypothetical protein